MKIQAELSLYPLQTDVPAETVHRFIDMLTVENLSVNPGPMSTVISGENEDVFRVLAQCFANVATDEQIVLVAKFSNACPTKAE
ncbi:MAG: YkoF family thiamine/hydroxymethylpyrimidine-binding protein [Alphaproteobacteria bacterium]